MGLPEQHEIEIAKNIKIIELLKCRLLGSISDLYMNMLENTSESIKARTDCLADIITISYMLSSRLGTPNNALDLKIVNKIKLELLSSNDSNWQRELKLLSNYLDKSHRN